MIEAYHFGKIKINGQLYDYDIYLSSSGEVKRWLREESHLFQKEDVIEAVKENPEVIVIGTGAYGVAEISQEAEKLIRDKGIELVIKRTGKAVEEYNKFLNQGRKVVALLHLTC